MEPSSRPRYLGPLLFLVIFAIYLAAPVSQIRDARYITAVSHALVHTGSAVIPEAFASGRGSYQLPRVGGERRYFFSEAPAVLNAPFVLLAEWVGISPVSDRNQLNRNAENRILRWLAALVAAATCWMLLRLASVYLDAIPAAGLVLVFAVGSPMFSTVSRPYWSHSWTVFLLTLSLCLVLAAGEALRPHAAVWAASCAMWAFFCRPAVAPMVLAIALLVLALTRRAGWRCLTAFALTCAAWLALLVAYSRASFGAWLPPYFFSAHVESGRWLGKTMVQNFLGAAAGTMVSPGRGLLIYLPLTAVAVFLAAAYWRRLPSRLVAGVCLGALLSHWMVIASFRNWWGGESYGPRLFSDALPWIFVLSAMVLAVLLRGETGAQRAAAPGVWALALLVAFGVFVHSRGAMEEDTLYWGREISRIRHLDHRQRQRLFVGQRLWNWRYPQFMAGLIDAPEVEVPEARRRRRER